MRKFVITSSKFTGEAQLLFSRSELLCRIDCSDTDMSAEIIKGFKAAVPVTISGLEEFSKQPSITKIVEVGYRIGWEEFWNAYKKKIHPHRCRPIWDSLSDADTIDALNGIKQYDAFLEKTKVRQKLDPENYLKNRSWQNQWQ
jgi:hypothetical protein